MLYKSGHNVEVPGATPAEVANAPANTKDRPWWWWTPYAGIIAIVVYCLSPFYWMLVIGLLLIVVVMLGKGGLLGIAQAGLRRLRARPLA